MDKNSKKYLRHILREMEESNLNSSSLSSQPKQPGLFSMMIDGVANSIRQSRKQANQQQGNEQNQANTDGTMEQDSLWDPQNVLTNNEYISYDKKNKVFHPNVSGVKAAQEMATSGSFIPASNPTTTIPFSSQSHHKCSTGAFELLGVLLGRNISLASLNISAKNAWNILSQWGIHQPLNMDGNGSNIVYGPGLNKDGQHPTWAHTNKEYVPQVGDVAVWNINTGNLPGHMAVYLGSTGWVSDFRQGRLMVYKGDARDQNIQIYRATQV